MVKKTNNLKIPSCLSNITKVEAFVEKMKDHYNISNEVFGNMLVAITEAVNNAIVHGNSNDEKKMVEIDIEQETSLMKFVVKDNGNGFDYNNLPDPTAPENIEKFTGRGVFLMKHL